MPDLRPVGLSHVVRRAVPAYLGRVLEVGRTSFRERFESVAGPAFSDAGIARYWARDVVTAEIAAGEVLVAADSDGVIQGTASVRPTAQGAAFLARLYVHPAAHGRGIGSALLDAAARQQPGDLWLTVLSVNSSARLFYERHGFTIAGELADPDGGPRQVRMVRSSSHQRSRPRNRG